MVHKIMEYSQAIAWVIGQMSLGERILYLSIFLGFFSMLYLGSVSPWIFNNKIIPRIEKKTGKRFEYAPIYRIMYLSDWFVPQNEIGFYIFGRLCALIFKGERGPEKKKKCWYLNKIGYTIDMASKFEIVMSCITVFCIFLFVVCGVYAVIADNLFYPQFTNQHLF